MQLCWVTNERYYSKLLRWFFTDDTSHVGVTFGMDDDSVHLAVDVNRPFGKVYDLQHWLYKYTVIWSMDVNLSDDHEREMYKLCRDYCVLRQYDMPAYYFGMIAGLKLKFLHISLPTVNTWSLNTGSTCQEILVPIVQSDVMQHIEPRLADVDFKRFSACTPDMTMDIMKAATKGNPRIQWRFNGG